MRTEIKVNILGYISFVPVFFQNLKPFCSHDFSWMKCIQSVVCKCFKFGYHLISSKINFTFVLLNKIDWDRIVCNWRNILSLYI